MTEGAESGGYRHAPEDRSGGTSQRLRPFVAVSILAWLVTVATGIWSMEDSQPVAAAAYQDMENLRTGFSWRVWVRRVHTWSSVVAILVGLVILVRALASRSSRTLAVAALGFAASGAAAAVVALILPWNQLALWSLAEGTRLPGTPSPFEDSTFVLLDGSRWSFRTLQTMRSVHQVGLPLISALFALSLGLFAFRRTDR